jgi:uncharacterized protein YegP (UPF0339 family)
MDSVLSDRQGVRRAALVKTRWRLDAHSFLMRGQPMATFELYKDNAGEFRWRFVSTNGRIIATSSEGYKAKADCQNGIDLVKRESEAAKVVEK